MKILGDFSEKLTILALQQVTVMIPYTNILILLLIHNFGGFQRKIDHSCSTTTYSHDPLHIIFILLSTNNFGGFRRKFDTGGELT